MELLVDNNTFLEEVTFLTNLNEFIETIFVNQDKGILQLNQTIKIDNNIHNISKEIKYDLKTTKFIIKSCKQLKGKVMISDIAKENSIYRGDSNCELIDKNINNIFSVEFSDFHNLLTYKFNLYNQSIFKKIFNPNTENKLVQRIIELSNDKSWILIPKKFEKVLKNSDKFEEIEKYPKKLIYCIGKLNGTNVYVNSEESSNVYFGNYSSITLILNNQLSIEDHKSMGNFQDTKKLKIKYQFIQNEELINLEVT